MLKLFQILLFTFIFLSISSSDISAQEVSDTSKVLVRFNEPLSHEGIFDIDNYIIYRDNDMPVTIFRVGIVPGDTAVVLFTEKHFPESTYKIIINNIKDKAGNTISENHKIASY